MQTQEPRASSAVEARLMGNVVLFIVSNGLREEESTRRKSEDCIEDEKKAEDRQKQQKKAEAPKIKHKNLWRPDEKLPKQLRLLWLGDTAGFNSTGFRSDLVLSYSLTSMPNSFRAKLKLLLI